MESYNNIFAHKTCRYRLIYILISFTILFGNRIFASDLQADGARAVHMPIFQLSINATHSFPTQDIFSQADMYPWYEHPYRYYDPVVEQNGSDITLSVRLNANQWYLEGLLGNLVPKMVFNDDKYRRADLFWRGRMGLASLGNDRAVDLGGCFLKNFGDKEDIRITSISLAYEHRMAFLFFGTSFFYVYQKYTYKDWPELKMDEGRTGLSFRLSGPYKRIRPYIEVTGAIVSRSRTRADRPHYMSFIRVGVQLSTSIANPIHFTGDQLFYPGSIIDVWSDKDINPLEQQECIIQPCQ